MPTMAQALQMPANKRNSSQTAGWLTRPTPAVSIAVPTRQARTRRKGWAATRAALNAPSR